jgi:hypothetical protein
MNIDAAGGRERFHIGFVRYATVLDVVVRTLEVIERGGVNAVFARERLK